MNSIVLINKPIDFRSSACVGIVRKKLGVKVGHAGTLDSTASGLLVLLTGNATRFCEYVMSLPKVYRAVIQFGKETNTYDYSGETVSEKGFSSLNDGKIITEALFSFSGYRMQRPPAVSAVKIDGQPAYKLARSGQDIDMKPRPVFFRKIIVLTPYNPSDGTIELEVHCGRGTYIRTLAHDLGIISGCGAYVKSLVRLSTGNFTLDDASSPDEKFKMLPLRRLAENFTRIYVSGRDEKSFTNGMSILLRQALRTSRGVSLKGSICVEGDSFLGFGSYAGYDYVKPDVIVPKDLPC